MAARRKTKSNGESTGSSALDARLAALRADIDALQSDLRGLANEVGGAAAERAQETANRVIRSAEAVADNAIGHMSERFEHAEAWTNDNMDHLREQVRTQPLAAMAVAMGAGALLGALLLRR